jgi:putrescine transport system substrate-binding protein
VFDKLKQPIFTAIRLLKTLLTKAGLGILNFISYPGGLCADAFCAGALTARQPFSGTKMGGEMGGDLNQAPYCWPMGHPKKKKTLLGFLAGFFMAVCLFLGGCSRLVRKEGPREQRIVYILNWAEYIPQEIITDFEKETGITVVYDVFDTVEALEAKLIVRSAYDVVFPPAWPIFGRALGANLFLPLDKKLIPNAQGFDPQIVGKLSALDPGLMYGVPYLWGTTGLGISRKALAKKDLPLTSLQSWSLVFDPKNVEKIHDLRICLLDSATDVLQAALLYLGHSPTTQDFALWDKAAKAVMKVRPWTTCFESGKQIENLVSGDFGIIQGFSTYCNMARQRDLGRRDLDYIIPKEGAVLWFDMMAIPKSAPHPKNAHRFINFILRPDVMARISNLIRAANAVPASYSGLDPLLRNNATIFPDAETLSRLHPDFIPSVKLMRHLSRQWLKIKMGFDSR